MTDTFQWQRCDAAGASCVDIAAATNPTYVVTSDDIGHRIRVKGTRDAVLVGESAPTRVIGAPGTVQVGVIANVAGYGTPRQTVVTGFGAHLIREDRGDYAISWAAIHGIKVIGIYWPDSLPAAALDADYIELDNEPYWGGVDVHTWAGTMSAHASSVRAARPSTPILLPLLAFANDAALGAGFDGSGNYHGSPWVQQINESHPELWAKVDGFAIHPYAPDAAWTPHSMDVVRAQLEAIPAAAGKPFWVTEIGWATGGGSWSTSEANQSAWLAAFLDAMGARGDVAGVTVYQLVDVNTADGSSSEFHYGLETDGLSHKPAYTQVQSRLT